MNFWECF